jgi:hypothetical protein
MEITLAVPIIVTWSAAVSIGPCVYYILWLRRCSLHFPDLGLLTRARGLLAGGQLQDCRRRLRFLATRPGTSGNHGLGLAMPGLLPTGRVHYSMLTRQTRRRSAVSAALERRMAPAALYPAQWSKGYAIVWCPVQTLAHSERSSMRRAFSHAVQVRVHRPPREIHRPACILPSCIWRGNKHRSKGTTDVINFRQRQV